MTPARVSRNTLPLWLALIGVGILDVALMLWTPSGDGYKSPWAVPLVSGFFLLLLAIALADRANHALGREMQAPVAAGRARATVPAMRPRDPDTVQPVHPFAIDVLKTENLPQLSPAAGLLVQRGRGFYAERLRIDRRGVWFLMLAHVALAIVGRSFDSAYPLPRFAWSWLLVVVAALIVFGQPGRTRLILLPAIWRFIGVVCGALTLVVAGLYAWKAIAARDVRPGLLAFAALATVAAYVIGLMRGDRRLRKRVMAHAPVKLLFLWVFGSQSPMFLFLGFAAVWRFLGTIQLLNGAGFMGDTVEIMTAFAKGRRRDLVVKTPEELSARMTGFSTAPGRMGMYAHHSLLCSDSVWKHALDAVLDDTHVILMDLRGFSPVNKGATYELGHLVNRFPAGRFVLLADDTTDLTFLTSTLRESWDAMAIDSPNRAGSSTVRVCHIGRASAKPGEFPQLPAIAREGDRLVEMLCERAATPAA